MKIITQLMNLFKLDSTIQMEYAEKKQAPIYMPNDYEQDDSQSITDDSGYDLTRFSEHEAYIIKHVWDVVNEKYPSEYFALGLANESYCIKYKPRYVLYELIILQFSDSDNPVDLFAVSLAYASKGAFYRKQALDYFERSEASISPDLLDEFLSYMPLHVYNLFSELYEKEHLYDSAICCTRLAKRFGEPGNSFFDDRISMLKIKSQNASPLRSRKMPEKQQIFEANVTDAANFFLKNNFLPPDMRKYASSTARSKKPYRKPVNLKQYAVMCNAYLEHQDEMEQYNSAHTDASHDSHSD